MNFSYRNASCDYTNQEIMKGYLVALSASVSIGLGLRKLLAPITASASGKKLLLLNSLVGSVASGTANFCNTISMRYKEIGQGIDIYKDEALT